MRDHVLNRPLPPKHPELKTLPKPKVNPEVDARSRKQKLAEQLSRALQRTTR